MSPQPRSSRSRPTAVIAAAAAGVLLVVTPIPAAAKPAPDYDAAPPFTGEPHYVEQNLAVNGQGGFPNYRIPALTVTNDGDLLASYDGRPTAADAPGPNWILQRRSTDGGRTWGEQTVIHAGRAEAPKEGYSDPSYIVDRHTGDIFNFHVFSMDAGFAGSRPGVDPADRNVLHAEVSVSRDGGRTWAHEIITADITTDLSWRSRFAASGQGIQLKYGPHAGRLLQQFTIINGAGQFQAVSVYSDDQGKTWQVGEPVGVGMDENKTVELSDGRVLLNSRDSHRSGFRKVAISTDGGVTYGEVTIDRELPDPANNASLVRAYPNAPRGSARSKVLLFSNAASSSSRTTGTVRMSCDDGETWPVSKVFQAGSMSYSTLATLPNGNVGLLYEPGTGIRFAELNLAWLEGVCAGVTSEDATIERGSRAVVDVVIENQGQAALRLDDVQLDVPAGWSHDAGRMPVAIAPGRTVTVPVTVDVPASAFGGTYHLDVTVTDRDGRRARGPVTITVPSTTDDLPGRFYLTGGTLTNPQADGYQVGDVLRFSYTVTNLSDAVTTVVPTGNLRNLDPAVDSVNCRFRNLAAHGSYTCTFANHVVTADDVAAGHFTPVTTWTSTSGSAVTVVEDIGQRVELG